MNGAESLIRTALAAGVEVCFANPGTTEMPLVTALDSVPGMRSVLGLFEGVCTGAADGYARMAGKPAITLLHLGPGLANGLANLHNARRAHSPVVNVVGDHATWHLAADAPLTSDVAGLAAPMSAWVRATTSADAVGDDMAEAIRAALTPPCGVATLIVAADHQWSEARSVGRPGGVPKRVAVRTPTIDRIAGLLADKAPSVLLLGGQALAGAGLKSAARIAAVSGARLMTETFTSRLERGRGIPPAMRLPYFPDQAAEALAGTRRMILAGARDPVSFFGYPGVPSRLAPAGCSVEVLAAVEEDVLGALDALAEALGAPASVDVPPSAAPPLPSGPLTPLTLGAVLAAIQPEGAIIVDESATSGGSYGAAAPGAAPHTCLMLTGGAIGQGLPTAVGAAIACPDRRVVALQADGSAMYTLQALWTMARESLNVTTILCSNRAYRILQIEAERAGNVEPGRHLRALTALEPPAIDWSGVARGLGVPAVRVESADDLAKHLARAIREAGPSLIEAAL
jgi:acetolactate synthase-1/2/3 large subunit